MVFGVTRRNYNNHPLTCAGQQDSIGVLEIIFPIFFSNAIPFFATKRKMGPVVPFKTKIGVPCDACPIQAKPRNNAAFWRKKLAANQARDRLVTQTLRRMGWRVVRIWEHALARGGRLDGVRKRLKTEVSNQQS